LPAREYIIRNRLIPILTPLSSRWTVPLSGGGRNEWRRWIDERGQKELRGQKRDIKKGYK
jgi:hypothetical protein